MKRLRPEALLSNEMIDEHHVRNCLNGEAPEPCDTTDYGGIFERGAERVKVIDPHNKESYVLLKQMMNRA